MPADGELAATTLAVLRDLHMAIGPPPSRSAGRPGGGFRQRRRGAGSGTGPTFRPAAGRGGRSGGGGRGGAARPRRS
jgi:hypothetical protein